MYIFTDKFKLALDISVNSTADQTIAAMYELLDCDLPTVAADNMITMHRGVPFVSFEGTDGLCYSLGFAHPGLCCVALAAEDATALAMYKLDSMLGRRQLSTVELSVSRVMLKAISNLDTLGPKDTVVSLGNAIGNAMSKYGEPAPESSVVLSCYVILSTAGLPEETYVFAKQHLARTVHSTADIEQFIKTRQ